MRPFRGSSTFEFAVVLILLAIFAAILFDRLRAIEEEAERLEVMLTIRHIDTGLKLAIGEKIMRGEEASITTLAEASPLDFLTLREEDNLRRWHYDPRTRTLSYEPRQPKAFDGKGRVSWRFTAYRDELGRITGLGLEALK